MTGYIVDLESFYLEASSEDEAHERARELISNGDVRISLIAEN